MSPPKYAQVAASIRRQVADGTLSPGQPAPSGAALARSTGYSVLTCRRALRVLIQEGVLVSGTSRNARPRVPGPFQTRGEQTLADATRDLSASLADRRRTVGLTQPQLAKLTGVSVTLIGHAETGRLWQSREFWERADKALSADGYLLRLHDTYRAATMPAAPVNASDDIATAVGASRPVVSVTITWGNGEVTTVYPPHHPAPQ